MAKLVEDKIQFGIVQIVKRIVGTKSDSRLAITREMLVSLITVLPSVCNSQYVNKLLKAAFSVAFHCLLRIDELAIHNGYSRHVLLLYQQSF
jgi:hypothetical protein